MNYEVIENGQYGWKTIIDGKRFYAYEKQDVINQAEVYKKQIYNSTNIKKENLRNDFAIDNTKKFSLPLHLQILADKINNQDKGFLVHEITSDEIFGLS